MPQETYDWTLDYFDEESAGLTTFFSLLGDSVDIRVSQPDPSGYYRGGRDGFEGSSQLGGDRSGYFEMGVNFPIRAATVTTTIEFTNNTYSGANSVTDVSFTLYDIDSTTTGTFQDQVTVRAYDADGNEIAVTMTAVDPSTVSVSGNTATSIIGSGNGPQGSVDTFDTAGNVDVSISGDVARIDIIYGNGPQSQFNPANQVIGISDLAFDLVPSVICFTQGTRLITADGPKPVERLGLGDRLLTADSGAQPVRWIGSTTVSGRGMRAPVRFAAGAVGNDAPLLVSPQHRVLVTGWRADLYFGAPEVLVPAIRLVNGRDITRAPCDCVSYWHVACDRHEVVFAEGAPCETLLVGAGSGRWMDRRMREELQALFPALFAPGAAPESARPCVTGPEVALVA